MHTRLTTICIAAALLVSAASARGQAAAPKPPALEFVFEEMVTLGPSQPAGETPQGNRNIVPITGGTFSGPLLKGHILPGGWDWQLSNPGGCFSLQADYMIQTDDGVIINVVNKGIQCKNSSDKPSELYTTPSFEAPKGRYDWLNGGAWVGTLEVTQIDGKPAVHLRFFRAR